MLCSLSEIGSKGLDWRFGEDEASVLDSTEDKSQSDARSRARSRKVSLNGSGDALDLDAMRSPTEETLVLY